MDRQERWAKEEGSKFGVIMTCVVVVLAAGAIWFALSR